MEKRINSVKKQTDNRFLNMYELNYTHRDGKTSAYFMVSRIDDASRIKLQQEEKPAEPAKESQEETSDTQESVNSETIQVEAELEDSMPHASEMDIASLLGIEGFEIRYTDYELTDTYPKDGEGFTVSASKDNTLMVLHFSLTNVSGDSLICDLFDANPDIRVNVNKAGYQKVENTFLMNDITTYYEELPKNQSVDVVTILEISNTAVESIDLQIASTEMFVE